MAKGAEAYKLTTTTDSEIIEEEKKMYKLSL